MTCLLPPPAVKGSYTLVIRLERETGLDVGRLGRFDFPAGHYLYFGNALNGLRGRIRRHLRRDEGKKLHWHVDYLTAVAEVRRVWWVADGARWECAWAQLALAGGTAVIAPGFGASDCPCSTHLVYLGMADESLPELRRRLGLTPETTP